jgi:hypothetical protein
MNESRSDWNEHYHWIFIVIGAIILLVFSLVVFPLDESIKLFTVIANGIGLAASQPEFGWPGKLRIPVIILFTFIGTAAFAGLAISKLLQSFEILALMYICSINWRVVYELRQKRNERDYVSPS